MFEVAKPVRCHVSTVYRVIKRFSSWSRKKIEKFISADSWLKRQVKTGLKRVFYNLFSPKSRRPSCPPTGNDWSSCENSQRNFTKSELVAREMSSPSLSRPPPGRGSGSNRRKHPSVVQRVLFFKDRARKDLPCTMSDWQREREYRFHLENGFDEFYNIFEVPSVLVKEFV